MAAPRRRAREMALQALFEMEIGSHDPQETLERLCQENRAPEELAEFSRTLLTGVLENRAQIDEAIATVAPDRPIAELSAVDRNLIRIAIRECMLDNLTPAGAAISEAVELAKKYGSDSSSRFVNGVLGSLSASGMSQEGK
jgi:transcription antitermination protein NusB